MRVLTVDLEYDWEGRGTRSVTEALPELLRVLRRHRARATFFTLGSLAERFPKQVRMLARKGHEIAAHSYLHHPLSKCTATGLEAEVRRTRQAFNNLKLKPTGFRAPYFMTRPALYPLLEKHGFRYDSSRSTFFPGRYLNMTPQQPYRNARLWELPVPNFTPFGGPPAGLSYYRLFHPLSRAFRKPYMLYLHPYEFLDQPPDAGMNPLVRAILARHSGSQAWTLLEELLGNDHWGTCSDYLRQRK